MIKKIVTGIFLIILVLLIVFLCGPRVEFEKVDPTPITLDYNIADIDSIITSQESNVPNLKEDNEARIVWADSIGQKTEYSVVYLHGFSSSQEEGDPIHENFAKRYGCNLYLSRIHDHGRDDKDMLKGLTPEKLIQSAKEAIAIGQILGEKVIVMSCSTGSTYAAYLSGYDDRIKANIMYSPNIDVYDPKADMVLWPWGEKMMEQVAGGDYVVQEHYTPEQAQYWSDTYHTDGIFAMMGLIRQTMTEEHFEKMTQPLFMGYYFKDRDHQDMVVSVSRMREFFSQVGTPEDKKEQVAFADVGRHVIAGDLFSEDWETVQQETYDFAEEVLGMVAKR